MIGAVVEHQVFKNHNYRLISYVESFVRNSKQRITSLLTPGIVRNDEPNEVLVEIFKGIHKTHFGLRYSKLLLYEKKNILFYPTDGKMKVTVNEVDEIFAQLEYVNHLSYFSFAADEDNQREEFFYYCEQNQIF